MPTKDITLEEAKIRFEKNQSRLNLPDALGKKFQYENTEYEVVGLGYRLRKNGLLVKNTSTGELRRVPLELLKTIQN